MLEFVSHHHTLSRNAVASSKCTESVSYASTIAMRARLQARRSLPWLWSAGCGFAAAVVLLGIARRTATLSPRCEGDSPGPAAVMTASMLSLRLAVRSIPPTHFAPRVRCALRRCSSRQHISGSCTPSGALLVWRPPRAMAADRHGHLAVADLRAGVPADGSAHPVRHEAACRPGSASHCHAPSADPVLWGLCRPHDGRRRLQHGQRRLEGMHRRPAETCASFDQMMLPCDRMCGNPCNLPQFKALHITLCTL